jgi:DnaA-homolog protein
MLALITFPLSILYRQYMAQQLLLDILPPSQPSFQNMVAGPNAGVIDALARLMPGQTLYVWGAAGSGRTHLLRATANWYEGTYLCANEKAAADIHDWLDHRTTRTDCICIDDVHRLTDDALGALFQLYNAWRETSSNVQAFRLVVSGSVAPMQLDIREDVRTRLGWGAVHRMQLLSDEDKLKALSAYANAHALPLSLDVLRWLLTHGSRDMRSLFAWIDALDRYGLAQHRPLTLPLLKSLLAEKSGLFE